MPPLSYQAAGPSTMMPAPKTITPPRRDNNKNPHLVVDKNVVDELLLVCGVIGSTVDPTTQKIVPVEDCLNWLQDLQRALRRDEDAYRPISLLLGQWKVVQQKMLPLVLSCRYDSSLVLTILKILVILTKPMSGAAKNAGSLVIDTKTGRTDEL
jgi:timeless